MHVQFNAYNKFPTIGVQTLSSNQCKRKTNEVKILIGTKLCWKSIEKEEKEVLKLYFKLCYFAVSSLQITSSIEFRILLSRAMLTQYQHGTDRGQTLPQDFLGEGKFHLFDELRQYAIYSTVYRYK